jgi:hypothetical protein
MRRAKPRPRQARATATESISASSAARLDTMKPTLFRPLAARVRDHAAVGEQLLEFLLAPTAIERGRMQCCERRRVARMRRAERRPGAPEQAVKQAPHRRGRRPASCGRASGLRR